LGIVSGDSSGVGGFGGLHGVWCLLIRVPWISGRWLGMDRQRVNYAGLVRTGREWIGGFEWTGSLVWGVAVRVALVDDALLRTELDYISVVQSCLDRVGRVKLSRTWAVLR
jgi:hypothetical protein